MIMNSKALGVVLSVAAAGQAFQPMGSSSRVAVDTTKLSMVATDPSTVSKKEYEDICGVSFDEKNLQERLQATNFLYPKHVEVIEDIAPIADAMVDEIVSIDGITEVGRSLQCQQVSTRAFAGRSISPQCMSEIDFYIENES